MTIEHDIGQVLWIGFDGTSVPDDVAHRLAAGHIGVAVLFARNLIKQGDQQLINIDALRSLNAALSVRGPDGTRCFTAVDQEGGVVQRLRAPATRWPPMMSFNTHVVDDETLAQRVGDAMGQELRAVGFDIDFAPILDVHTNPANPIIGDRAFGTEPATVARRALAFARGLASAGVLSCGKHFPGHGDTATDSHLELPRVDHDWPRLRSVELAPFAAAANADMPMLMTAHVVFSALADVPATLSSKVITDLLRHELRYQGVIVSDDLDMKAIAEHYGVGTAAVTAIRAGCDALLLCRDQDHQRQAFAALVDECQRDQEFAQQVATSAQRIRDMKSKHEQLQALIPARPQSLGCDQHRALAVLLRGAVG
jgi:beta-N-acetylhexosaminidase